MEKDLLTENEVIEAVTNYLKNKGRTEVKQVIHKSDASQKEHGVDLKIKLANNKGRGNYYFIEAKGNKRSDGTPMSSAFNTNFRWAISQIILRIKVDSALNNYIYGIAIPQSEIEGDIRSIHNNGPLKHLKIRLYGAFRNETDELTAIEYCPENIYKYAPSAATHSSHICHAECYATRVMSYFKGNNSLAESHGSSIN